jgi:hypothetical protein
VDQRPPSGQDRLRLPVDDILNRFPGFFSGSYTFRSLASFAGGRPNGANEFCRQGGERRIR